MAYGNQAGVTHAARYAFWSRRDGNYIVGNNSGTSALTKGDDSGGAMLRVDGIRLLNSTIPEPPRNPHVGDGGTLVTINGRVTEAVTGTLGTATLEFDFAAAVDGRSVYTRASDKVLGHNISRAVSQDLAFVVNQENQNRDTSGSTNENASNWYVTEHLLVEATQLNPEVSGVEYNGQQWDYSLTFNETNVDLFGTTLTAANYGYANNIKLSYFSPAPVFYQTFVGDGAQTTFTIPSDYVPYAEDGDAVIIGVDGTLQTYDATTGYTVSGQTITFNSGAPADGAIIVVHVKFQVS
jgi:hypothetical protein